MFIIDPTLNYLRIERIIEGGSMAVRPIFISTGEMDKPFLVEDISFPWVSGMSYSQKCKRRDSLAQEISKLYDIKRWLEISTKSDKEIGVKLSAKNLVLTTSTGSDIVENIYQGSKVFDDDKIVSFKYNDCVFENCPTGMFYDYIYIFAILQNKDLIRQFVQYDIFSDIEFNPKKSVNTQARAAAIFKTLYDNHSLDIIKSQSEFKRYYKNIR